MCTLDEQSVTHLSATRGQESQLTADNLVSVDTEIPMEITPVGYVYRKDTIMTRHVQVQHSAHGHLGYGERSRTVFLLNLMTFLSSSNNQRLSFLLSGLQVVNK